MRIREGWRAAYVAVLGVLLWFCVALAAEAWAQVTFLDGVVIEEGTTSITFSHPAPVVAPGLTVSIAPGLKDFARPSGPPIALGDTDFVDAIEDAVDLDRTTWDPATRILTLTSTDGTPKALHITAGSTSSGLTQGEVDGRINILVPPELRLPTYNAGDVGEYLAVATGGTSTGFRPLPIPTATEMAAGSGGDIMVLNPGKTGFVLAPAPAPGGGSTIVAGGGIAITQGGGSDTVSVSVGDGIEINNGKVKIKLDATRATAAFSLGANGLDLGPGGVVTDRIAGDAVTAPKLANNAVDTDAILNASVTEPKLATAVQEQLHTDAEIEEDFRRHEADRAVDVVAEVDDINLQTGSPTFAVGGTTWEYSSLDYSAGDEELTLALVLSGGGAISEAMVTVLRGFHFEINAERLAVASAAWSVTPSGPRTSLDLVWSAVAPDPTSTGATNRLAFYEPLDPQNYVPGGGTAGQFMTPDAVGDREWRAIAVGDLPFWVGDSTAFAGVTRQAGMFYFVTD